MTARRGPELRAAERRALTVELGQPPATREQDAAPVPAGQARQGAGLPGTGPDQGSRVVAVGSCARQVLGRYRRVGPGDRPRREQPGDDSLLRSLLRQVGGDARRGRGQAAVGASPLLAGEEGHQLGLVSEPVASRAPERAQRLAGLLLGLVRVAGREAGLRQTEPEMGPLHGQPRSAA